MFCVDLFCGAGLFSLGARFAGCTPVGAVDWDSDACSSYASNHGVSPVCADVRQVDFDIWRGVDGIVASPPCTTYSPAAPARGDSDLPAEIVRAARCIGPRWVVVENVPSFRSYASFRSLCDSLARMGYVVYVYVLDSARFGVPQRRRRLYIVASREMLPTLAFAPRAAVPVASILDDDLPLVGDLADLVPATLARIARAPRSLARFIVVYRGGFSRGWQSLDEPLLTVTTVNGYMLVDRARGHRMLSERELRRAMSIPESYVLCGSSRARMRQIGNAVVPAVASAVVSLARRGRQPEARW